VLAGILSGRIFEWQQLTLPPTGSSWPAMFPVIVLCRTLSPPRIERPPLPRAETLPEMVLEWIDARSTDPFCNHTPPASIRAKLPAIVLAVTLRSPPWFA